MAKLDDLIEEFRNDGRDEEAEELEKLRGSSLREKAQKADALEKERDELKARVEALEMAPKRQKAFEDYGIDLGNLSKAERKVLEGYDGDLDEDALASLVEEFELPVLDGNSSGEKEPTAGEKIAGAARKSAEGGSRNNKAPTITPDDAAAWSTDKAMVFAREHPDEWDALKRGENVTGLTG